MYLIFLVKDGKEMPYSTIESQPQTLLDNKLKAIANEHQCQVIARSHCYTSIREIHIHPKQVQDSVHEGSYEVSKTALEKVLSGESA